MREFIGMLDAVIVMLRPILFALLLLATAAAAVVWAVRTRRLNAFGPLARFSRSTLEPLLAPLERRTVRAGSTNASAPWWALLLLLMLGVGALWVLEFVRNALAGAYVASLRGPSGLLRLAVTWTFAVLQLAVLVRVVISWVGGTHSAIGRLAIRLTEWFLAPLRRVLPSFGALDLSPLIAWFLLGLIQGVILRVL
jgi:YggT family protein